MNRLPFPAQLEFLSEAFYRHRKDTPEQTYVHVVSLTDPEELDRLVRLADRLEGPDPLLTDFVTFLQSIDGTKYESEGEQLRRFVLAILPAMGGPDTPDHTA